MKIVIIGAGAGGASVAARARRLDEHAEIIMIDKSYDISQATCGLPYSLGGIIDDRQKLVVVDDEEFAKILNVDVRTRSKALSISRAQKTIVIRDLRNGNSYSESYDRLVLSPGGRARMPDSPGVNQENVFTLQSLEDLDGIKAYLNEHTCRTAVIVGAGFVGLEVADNLHELGIKVSIVEVGEQVINQLDFEMATIVHQHLFSKNIGLVLRDRIDAFEKAKVILASGRILPADIVIVGMGINPATRLARLSGLKLGKSGGIAVSDGMVTSDMDIFALGDAVEVDDLISGSKTLVQLAGPAHKQAAVVAENILGGDRKINAVQGTTIAKIFDLTVAKTGCSEKQLKTGKISYQKSYIDVPSHAAYYPNAFSLMIKLLFESTSGKILGAQIVGVDGVDKRIDIIATAIHFKKTIYDLAELDLAYAPPYSSAKDPVNIAGMVAKNMISENYKVVYWDEVPEASDKNVFLLDVRTEIEFTLGAIPGSTNIPLDVLRKRLQEVPKDRKIIVYCQQGKKGYFAYKILTQHGHNDVANLSGGFKLYKLAVMYAGGEKAFQYNQIFQSGQPYVQESTNAGAGHPLPTDSISFKINATGMSCPGPMLRLNDGIKRINDGEYLLITASDPGFNMDIDTWCRKTGNILYHRNTERTITTVVIEKHSPGNVGKL